MTIDEINIIRLALDTPEHNRHYTKHTTDAKMILNKEQEAINYTQCCETLPSKEQLRGTDLYIHLNTESTLNKKNK